MSVPIRTVLVAVDLSPLTDPAVASATLLTRQQPVERIHLLHVVDSVHGEETAAQLKLRGYTPPVSHTVTLTREVCSGKPTVEIDRVAEELGADIVIVSSHGHTGLKRALLGSVSSILIRNTSFPVLVVGPTHGLYRPPNVTLVGVDGTDAAERILAHAYALTPDGATIRIVSVLEGLAPDGHDDLAYAPKAGDMREIAEARARTLSNWARNVGRDGVNLQVEITATDAPPRELLEQAEREHPDLIVVGTSGRSLLQRMLIGSTATRVTAEAPCPVLVVPHADE